MTLFIGPRQGGTSQAGPQRFQHCQQHLLNEIVSRWRGPQVAKAVEVNARRHPPADFRFGLEIAMADAQRQIGIAQPNRHRPSF